MPYSRNLTRMACAVALALGAAASAQAATVLEVTDSFRGPAGAFRTESYDFTIATAGTYLATLIDTGIFTSFDDLGLGIAKIGGAPAGVLTAPGSFSFSATAGDYTAIVGANMGSGTFPLGTYSVSVALIPEPETWAMMLVGMGLVGWQLRRKVKSSAASRFV
jgi:hypothetical protein